MKNVSIASLVHCDTKNLICEVVTPEISTLSAVPCQEVAA